MKNKYFNMNRLFITFLIFLCTSLIVNAQSAKQKLGFIPYADPSADKDGYRQMAYDYLYEAATRIFINTQRFEILDRSKFDIVKLEKNITKGEDFINSEIVAQGNALAAEVLAVAKVTALTMTESKEQGSWAAFFTVEFKQIDVETTKALNAMQLKGQTMEVTKEGLPFSNLTIAKSPEEAISKIVSGMEKTLGNWIEDNFPLKMRVIDINRNNQILYAKGGKDIGLSLNNKMCLRRVHRLSTGDIVEETVADLKYTKEDRIGETTTKFIPKNKKDWGKLIQALDDHGDQMFIMERPKVIIKIPGLK